MGFWSISRHYVRLHCPTEIGTKTAQKKSQWKCRHFSGYIADVTEIFNTIFLLKSLRKNIWTRRQYRCWDNITVKKNNIFKIQEEDNFLATVFPRIVVHALIYVTQKKLYYWKLQKMHVLGIKLAIFISNR